MKKIFIGILILSAFASCKKADLAPLPRTADSIASQTNANYSISYETPTQVVSTHVKSDTLLMIYHENISLLLNPAEYASAWAVHLIENFDATNLGGVDYTTVNPQGIAVHNVVDDNMNNVILKSVSDTTISGIVKKKMRVFRQFTFVKIFGSNETALSAQNKLLETKDQMSFSAYYYADKPVLINDNATLIYTKDQ